MRTLDSPGMVSADREEESMDTTTRPGGLVGTTFAAAVTLGGANFIAVRFSNRELDPFFGAGLRFALAATLFVIITLVLRLPWPRRHQLALTLLYGLLGFAAFYALMYWALLSVTAGVATVVLALVPLVTMLLAAAQGLERLRGRALLGSLLAMAGIVWMVAASSEVVLPLSALVAMIGAALCAGEGVIVTKKVSGNHPAVTNAVGMLTGAGALFVLSALAGESWALPRQPEVVWSLVYLVTLGSVGLFILLMLVVRRWTASATSYMFVLFPVVTMVLDMWLSNEPITRNGAVGAILVMAGVWFGALSSSTRTSRPATRPERPIPVFEKG
jgi:drug/metabolite transporter (DMT)-like permease